MQGRKRRMDQQPCIDASAGIVKARSKSAAISTYTSDREREENPLVELRGIDTVLSHAVEIIEFTC